MEKNKRNTDMNEDKDFEEIAKTIQRMIDREEEAIYSRVVIREYRNPSNLGFIEDPDVSSEVTGICGDTMKISLRIKNNRIIDACFWTDGCGATIASGSMLTKMIKGKNIEKAADISDRKLLDALGGLPEEHRHCATLAVATLQKAVKQYLEKKKNLGKKR